MSKEQDKRIAEWVGGITIMPAGQMFSQVISMVMDGQVMEKGHFASDYPAYTTKDSEAVSLLMVMVNRGYCPSLVFDDDGHWAVSLCGIQPASPMPASVQSHFEEDRDMWKPTIAEAICDAVLSIIETEEDSGDGKVK